MRVGRSSERRMNILFYTLFIVFSISISKGHDGHSKDGSNNTTKTDGNVIVSFTYPNREKKGTKLLCSVEVAVNLLKINDVV